MTELERRLKLTRFLREENAENRVRMKNREEILYGSGKPLDPQELPLVYEGYLNETGYVPDAPSPVRSSLRLRAALALLLLGLVVYTDQKGTNIAGQNVSALIRQQLSVSMEDKLLELAEGFGRLGGR